MLESLTDLPVKNWEELWRYCGDSMWKSVEMIWAELKTSCSWGTPSPVHFRLPQCGVRTSSEVVMWTKPSGNHRVNHHNCAETLSWHMADVQLQMNQRYTFVSFFSCHFIFVTSASSRWFCFGPGASDTVWHWWQKYVVPGPRIPGSDSVLQDRSQGLHSPHGMSRWERVTKKTPS